MLSPESMTKSQRSWCNIGKIAPILLQFGGYQLGDADVLALAEGLKENKSLSYLDLDRNHITDVGALAIANAIKGTVQLGTLSLAGNQIGDAGAKAIAAALQKNTTIIKLVLSQNQIGTAGAQAIAKAIKANSTLKCLDLTSNCIGSAGVRALARAHKVDGTQPAMFFHNQIHPLVFSHISRPARTDDRPTVLRLLTERPELEDQSAHLPALPIEIADLILDEARYWQGVQQSERLWDDDQDTTCLRTKVPRSIHAYPCHVKLIQVFREWDSPKNVGSDVFDVILLDEAGEARFKCTAKATSLNSTLQLATFSPASHPVIREMCDDWKVQLCTPGSGEDLLCEWINVGYIERSSE